MRLGAGSADNVTLAVVPMFHITGMVSVMHASIYSAATIVIMPRCDRGFGGPPDFTLAGDELDEHPHHGD